MNAEHLLAHFDRVADAPDAIPRLRRFILDLAVRGKLVEQDPNDEPAAELLKRIAAEKKRMVEAGKIKKQRAIPTHDETELPFTLPVGWRWSQIAKIGLLSPRNEATDDIQASFVPMPMIASDYGEASGHEVRRWGDIKKGYTHFAEGDVGLAKITPCFQNGKSTVFRNLTGGLGSGTTELHIIRPLFVNPNFILLFLKCPYFIETGIPRMTGTAGQKRVPTEYFAHSPFPLPPLAEQHRIVAKVDELMALCDRLETARKEREATRDRLAAASLARLNTPDPDLAVFQNHAAFALNNLAALTTRPDQIKALRQAILNLAVRGKLVEQDPEDEPAAELLKQIAAEKKRLVEAGEIRKPKSLLPLSESDLGFDPPSGWEQIRLGTLVLDSESGWSPQTENHAREGDAWGILKVSAVSWNHFDPTANKQILPGTEPRLQAQVHRDDFLISRSNTAELVARAVVVQDEPRNLMMSDKIVRLRLSAFCNHNYALLVNNISDSARSYYADNATGTSPSMKNVSRKVILDLPFPLPPLAEQRRIVAKVDELMTQCDRLEASLLTGDETHSRLLDMLLHEVLESDGSYQELAR